MKYLRCCRAFCCYLLFVLGFTFVLGTAATMTVPAYVILVDDAVTNKRVFRNPLRLRLQMLVGWRHLLWC